MRAATAAMAAAFFTGFEAASGSSLEAASPSSGLLAADDECAGDDETQQCSLHALQRRGVATTSSRQDEVEEPATDEDSPASLLAEGAETNGTHDAGEGIWHYAWNCWDHCGGAGMCEKFCGPGGACCRYLASSDPLECANIRFWPVRTYHTCVKSPWGANPTTAGGEHFVYTKASLMKPSSAPLLDFYLYRVQSNETYDPMDQDLANVGGALWYLHNEIVWHKHMQRSGTYFSNTKTRVEKFRIKTRATEPLYQLGMNFGVVNTFDSTKCTGPFDCYNFKNYGYTVGCENWEKDSPSAFPHSQWVGQNKYPGAAWYSLPGPCPTKGLGHKTKECMIQEPGGKCVGVGDPTGEGNCTFTFEKVGEISIDELEGISDPAAFVASGGEEYSKKLDAGIGNHFWDRKMDVTANKWREARFEQLFKEKYPNLPVLDEPKCDFDKYKFFPGKFGWNHR